MSTTGRLEEMLAALLRYGSWTASAAIAFGYALALIGNHGHTRGQAVQPNIRMVSTGIALFILLPILRVSLMFLVFIHERDFRFAFISGMVLAIILIGMFFGVTAT